MLNDQNIEPEPCMEGIYKKMIKLMQGSIKEQRQENLMKQSYLTQKGREHQKHLDECIEDKANLTILNGDIEVRILRTSSTKNLGPGSYKIKNPQTPKSHNIMNYMQKSIRSNSRKQLNHSNIKRKKSNCSFGKIKVPKIRLNVKCAPIDKKLLTEVTPLNENNSSNYFSKEETTSNNDVLINRQQAFGESKKAIEKYRRIVEQSQSILNKTGEVLSLTEEELENMKECEESQILIEEF